MKRRMRRVSLGLVAVALAAPIFSSSGANAGGLCVSAGFSVLGKPVYRTSPCVWCPGTTCTVIDDPPPLPVVGGPTQQVNIQIQPGH
jgi:hypothetical protein